MTQYIESVASKALDMREAKKVLREARQRVANNARVAAAAGRKRKVVRIESDHDWSEQDLTQYLPSRGRITNDIFNGRWRASSDARWPCACYGAQSRRIRIFLADIAHEVVETPHGCHRRSAI